MLDKRMLDAGRGRLVVIDGDLLRMFEIDTGF
jgi:hypothetical protein